MIMRSGLHNIALLDLADLSFTGVSALAPRGSYILEARALDRAQPAPAPPPSASRLADHACNPGR